MGACRALAFRRMGRRASGKQTLSGRIRLVHTMASSLAVARRAALQARAAVRLRHYANAAASESTEHAPALPKDLVHEDDDPQLADYPRLPYVSKQLRPARGWDDMQFRRNYGETVRKSSKRNRAVSLNECTAP